MTQIVTIAMTAKDTNCSMFASRHQARQRSRLASSSRTMKPSEGSAWSSPVIGETSRGIHLPMP